MRRLRLLFVVASHRRGGVEEVILGLLRHLDRERFALAFAAPRALLEAMAEDLAPLDVVLHDAVPTGCLELDRMKALASFIRAFRPDVVNTHLFRTTALVAPLARALAVPAVVETYHGREAWRAGALKGCFAIDRAVTAAFVDRVIAVSEASRRFLLDNKHVPPAKVVTVPNGREPSRSGPADRDEVRRELGVSSGTVLGILGRLEEQKGHRYLLRALPDILREEPALWLLVVGEGSLRDALERDARELGVDHRVIFTGFRSDVPRVLAAVDVVVQPSLYEGLPLTCIEAAAAAKPIVAPAVDGTPEVVAHGETGLLVPPGDSCALADAVLQLLRDPATAIRLGRRARVVALDRFSLSASVRATAEIFRSVGAGRLAAGV